MSIDDEVTATFRQFEEAWNAHDPERLAACWVENGNLVHPWGRFASGRRAIAELLAEEHEVRMARSRNRTVALSTRAIGEEAVVAEGEGLIENVIAPNGKSYALEHAFSAVLVRDGDAWRFMSFQPTMKPAQARA